MSGEDDSVPEVPGGGPLFNRAPGRTAAAVNLDGAAFGFRVTGDAAWDSGSDDFAMFSAEGNAAVAAMVRTARILARCKPEAEVEAWLDGEKARLAGDAGTHLYLPRHQDATGRRTETGHEEVRDTMTRETIAYALDEAWTQAYGHRFGEAGA